MNDLKIHYINNAINAYLRNYIIRETFDSGAPGTIISRQVAEKFGGEMCEPTRDVSVTPTKQFIQLMHVLKQVDTGLEKHATGEIPVVEGCCSILGRDFIGKLQLADLCESTGSGQWGRSVLPERRRERSPWQGVSCTQLLTWYKTEGRGGHQQETERWNLSTL